MAIMQNYKQYRRNAMSELQAFRCATVAIELRTAGFEEQPYPADILAAAIARYGPGRIKPKHKLVLRVIWRATAIRRIAGDPTKSERFAKWLRSWAKRRYQRDGTSA